MGGWGPPPCSCKSWYLISQSLHFRLLQGLAISYVLVPMTTHLVTPGKKDLILCLSNLSSTGIYSYMSMVVRLDFLGFRVSVYGACIWLWLWHYRFNSQLGLLTPSSSCPYSGQDRSSILRELFFNNDVRGIIDLILAPEDERANWTRWTSVWFQI